MKKLFLLLLFACSLNAQVGPPPASPAEVAAGTDRYKYLTPYSAAVSGISSNGITAAGATNIIEAMRQDSGFDIGGSAASVTDLAENVVEVADIASTNASLYSTYNGQTSFRLTLKTNPPPLLNMDDDGEDIDGLIQHAVLLRLHELGEVEIKSITKCNTNEYSVGAVEVLNRFYGATHIPVGVRRDGVTFSHTMSWETNIVRYNTNLCSYLSNTNTPGSVALHRWVLANAAPNSQDFLVSGQSFNIYNLFNSAADDISPLTGAELIFAKARDFYVVAGEYPSGTADHNLSTGIQSAQVWEWIGTTNSANRVIWVDIALGTGTATGGNYVNRPGYDPIYQACTNYIQAIGGSLPRPAWGSQGVLAAVRGTNQWFAGKRVFEFSAAGTNAIDVSGNNTFTEGSGNQFYLTSTLTTSEWNDYVNGFFDQPPLNQNGLAVRRTGDSITGRVAINISATNALSVGTNALVVDTTTNRVIIGAARTIADNPYINARLEVNGSNAVATLGQDTILQLSRQTGPGISFAQGTRFTIGRYETPSSFEPDTLMELQVKTGGNSLLNDSAGWVTAFSVSSNFFSMPTRSLAQSVTATNFVAMATNYVAANFVPIAGQVKMAASNDWMYSVTPLLTNRAFQINP